MQSGHLRPILPSSIFYLIIPNDYNEKLLVTKKNNNAMNILMDAIKDYIFFVISKLDVLYDIFTFLENMYEINNTNRALALK